MTGRAMDGDKQFYRHRQPEQLYHRMLKKEGIFTCYNIVLPAQTVFLFCLFDRLSKNCYTSVNRVEVRMNTLAPIDPDTYLYSWGGGYGFQKVKGV